MVVRRLRSGDGELLRRLASRFKGAAAPETFLDDPRTVVVAALEDGEPVGFLLAYELPRIDDDDTMVFLYELEVAERWRRRGVGRTLVGELRRETPLARKTFVLTDDENPGAVAFYAAVGGRRVSPDQVMFEWRPR